MKKVTIFHINNRLFIKKLGFVYWHIAASILWLQALIVMGGLAIAFLDKKPIGETMYLAFITALTIGYGDLTPESGLSKLIAIGIGFLGIVFTGLMVAATLKALELTINEQKKGGSKQGD
jgi:hypothetical protein